MVVLAIFIKSYLKSSSLDVFFLAKFLNVSKAQSLANLQPSIMINGWIFYKNNFSASLNNSPASTQTVVVPSPTSSS